MLFSRIRRLWSDETHGLTTAAFFLGTASVLSRLAGLVRDRLLASTFGAGPELDAYYAAFRWPDVLYNLLIVGALSTGFIPVCTEYLRRRGEDDAKRLAGQTFSLVAVILLVFCALLIIGASWVVPFTVAGFDPDRQRLTVDLTRIMALSPLLLGLSAVMGGILQTTKRFFAFALAPIFYNGGIIAGILLFAPRFGIRGVAGGVVLGAALHFVAQASVVRRSGWWSIPWPTVRSEGIRRIAAMMGPRTLGLAITQINVVILLFLASSLPVGSVAVFSLAQNLQSFALGVVGVSFAVASLPLLSSAAADQDADGYADALGRTARRILLLIIPLALLMFLLRAQIVRVVLGDGAFGWNDTIRTLDVFAWFVLSLPAQALVPLFARAFYALHNTWTPVKIGLVAEAVNILFAYFLRGMFGINGLAIAFSISALVQAIVLWIWLRRQSYARRAKIHDGLWQVIVASFALLIIAKGVSIAIGATYDLRRVWQVLFQAGASSILSGAAYIAVLRLLRNEEVLSMIAKVRDRYHKRWKHDLRSGDGV